ncbi:MAG: glycerophosphodiester phosphodiesterase family protein [Hyphomonadaceae bacterium]
MRGALPGAFAALALLAGCTTNAGQAPLSLAPARAIAPDNLSEFFDCLRREGAALVAAHRGGPTQGYAENALETFAHTLSQGPALIEADVALTGDGELVLMHDDTVDRTTNGSGRVDAMTLAQIQALTLEDNSGAATGAHPPSLREALDWAQGKTILELDIKRNTPLERVVEAVREAGAEGRVILIVYSFADAVTAHRLAPDMMISTPIRSMRDLEALEEADVDLARVLAWTGIEEPDSELNIRLRQEDVEVIFGTLGGLDERFAQAGEAGYAATADTGVQLIATDRPAAAHAALDAADGEGWAAEQCLSE